MDRLWAALKLGGLGLEVLRLGGCHIAQTKRSVRNSGKDSAQIANELFSSFLSLKELDLTGTHLTTELLSGILEGFKIFKKILKKYFKKVFQQIQISRLLLFPFALIIVLLVLQLNVLMFLSNICLNVLVFVPYLYVIIL